MNAEAECHPARSKNTHPGTKFMQEVTPLAATSEGRRVPVIGLDSPLLRRARLDPGSVPENLPPCRNILPLKVGKSTAADNGPVSQALDPLARHLDRLFQGLPGGHVCGWLVLVPQGSKKFARTRLLTKTVWGQMFK